MLTSILDRYNDKTKINLLELGNQKILYDDKTFIVSKIFLEKLGVKHVSVDINGLDGSIILDLTKPLPTDMISIFDIVTDFGTIEHIEKQEQVFKSVHDACKIGGYMIHSLPLNGYWVGHCPYHYENNFPDNLAYKNGYELIFKEEKPRRRERFINFIFKKTSQKLFGFTTNGLSFTKNYKRNEDNLF
jgi:SAM-dependent methyltransferase